MANEQGLPTITIDVVGYPAKKAKGLAKIRKIDDAYFFCLRRYDPDTAEALPLHIPISRTMLEDFRKRVSESLEKAQAQATADLAGCDALLADIDAAKEV